MLKISEGTIDIAGTLLSEGTIGIAGTLLSEGTIGIAGTLFVWPPTVNTRH